MDAPLERVLRQAEYFFPQKRNRECGQRLRLLQNCSLEETLPAFLRALIKPITNLTEEEVAYLRQANVQVNELIGKSMFTKTKRKELRPLASLYGFYQVQTDKKTYGFLFDFLFVEKGDPQTPLPAVLLELLEFFDQTDQPWLKGLFQEWVGAVSRFVEENQVGLVFLNARIPATPKESA